MNYLKPISNEVAITGGMELARENSQDRINEQNRPQEIRPKLARGTSDELLWDRNNQIQPTSEPPSSNSIDYLQQSRHLLVAAVQLPDFTIRYANDSFLSLMGIQTTGQDLKEKGIKLFDLFTDLDGLDAENLYRQQLLQLVLRDIYQIDVESQFDRPRVAYTGKSVYADSLWVKCWLQNQNMRVIRIDSELDELADFNLQQQTENWANTLADPAQMELLLSKLNPDNYQLEGLLLLEGVEITVTEKLRRLTNLLIDQDSILRPKKFRQVNQILRSLFRTQHSLILTTEREQARMFVSSESKQLKTTNYSMLSLQDSHFLRAADTNQVVNVPDLSQDCPTECERSLLKSGVRSLLLIPLVVKASGSKSGFRQLAGVVGLASDRPYNFNSADYRYASELILPFTVALRQAIQQRFTQFNNIHPAVEWKFLQEAERRSWGMPPESVVFNNVYPLYGISDIRGSSEERNRAIQTDLLEQYHLALNVVEAFCQAQPTSLGEQLRLDLMQQIEQLKLEITVDAEVTAIRYLRENLEIYFDYFAGCSQSVLATVEAYRAACNNEHQCVYNDRNRYDQTIGQINSLLRETWERWQISMQKITPHYCDTESTDGIDHMIYAGASIDPKFTTFHLRSLRYEQLRAICDCARTAFSIQEKYNTLMEVTHLLLLQDATVDIFHNEDTEKLFEVRGTRDTRYEIVKKRIDKAVDGQSRQRITQPGMLTIVYTTEEEWTEYQQYIRYLVREGWVDAEIETGTVEPLQGVTGLKFARFRILPDRKFNTDTQDSI